MQADAGSMQLLHSGWLKNKKPQLRNVSQPFNFAKNQLQTCSQNEPNPSVPPLLIKVNTARQSDAESLLPLALHRLFDFLKWWYVGVGGFVFKQYLSILV
jgi:hypothetical protein